MGQRDDLRVVNRTFPSGNLEALNGRTFAGRKLRVLNERKFAGRNLFKPEVDLPFKGVHKDKGEETREP
jgi:hypothetical protein